MLLQAEQRPWKLRNIVISSINKTDSKHQEHTCGDYPRGTHDLLVGGGTLQNLNLEDSRLPQSDQSLN